MRKRKIFEILTTVLFSFSALTLNVKQKTRNVEATDGVTQTAIYNSVQWNNVIYGADFIGSNVFGNVDANGVPLDGYVALIFFDNKDGGALEFDGKNVCNASSQTTMMQSNLAKDASVNDIYFNGVNISEVQGAGLYIYPQNGLLIYLPNSSLTYNAKYSKPMVTFGESAKVLTTAITPFSIYYDGVLGSFNQWKVYVEKDPATPIDYSGIANSYWDNAIYPGTEGYRHTILAFGTLGMDFFSESHNPDPTERAIEDYEIGKNLKFNGIPFYKIRNLFPKTQLDYAHGNNFMHLCYPEELLLSIPEYPIPTIELETATEFVEGAVNPFKIQLICGHWQNSDYQAFKVEKSINVSNYLHAGTWPFQFENTDSLCLATSMPQTGADLAITINTGTDGGSVCNFIYYGLVICFNVAYQGSGIIQILDQNYGLLETYYGFPFENYTDYILEISAKPNGNKGNYKVAINHALIFDEIVDIDFSSLSNGGQIWTVNNPACWIFKDVVELPSYSPTILFNGPSFYDFMEGDDLYDFSSMFKCVNIYSDDDTPVTLTYTEGAVTSDKYNAGNWKLIAESNIVGYGKITKVIDIYVHGSISYASIKFGDAEPIEAVIGSRLAAPRAPTKESDDLHDYVFDGWYFEGAKWNFETDIVLGDMELEARFVPTERRCKIVVTFEGFEKPNQIFKVKKGSNFSFVVFEEPFANSLKVYKDDVEITSLVVNEDVELKVVYDVFTYNPAVEATCDTLGTVAYYASPFYPGYYFADPNGKIIINNIHTPKLDHTLLHIKHSEATCLKEGNVECYYCPNCGKHYQDADGTIELEHDDWIIEKLHHNVIHHEYKGDTCFEDGHIEYYECSYEPGMYYADEECTQIVDEIVIESLGHRYYDISYKWGYQNGKYVCRAQAKCVGCGDIVFESKEATSTVVREATCAVEGEICYFVSFENKIFNSQTKLTKVPKLDHNLKFVAGYSATESSSGMKDHYECEDCGTYFVKNGNNYVEVDYSNLIIPKSTNEKKKGCSGSINGSAFILACSIGACIALLSLRKKEEK